MQECLGYGAWNKIMQGREKDNVVFDELQVYFPAIAPTNHYSVSVLKHVNAVIKQLNNLKYY